MKISYNGFELEAVREGEAIRYSAFRERDQYELISGFAYDTTVRTEMGGLKFTVDDFLKNPEPYEDDPRLWR